MDLSYHLNENDLKKRKQEFKKIFFYRICGTGMGAAAILLREKGIEVEGGDIKFYPPMGDYLKSSGIKLFELDKLNEEYYRQFDLIVVGNVVGGKSPEARFIESLKIPFVSFPQALGAFVLNDVNVVGIAGTHGKTTTTYLFTQVFENLGLNPGYFIGGVMEGRPSSRLGDGKYFFIESDEYDSAYFQKVSKFRSYEIDHLVLTSLEFDHGDIFKDLEAILDQFRALIPKVSGSFIFCQDYPACLELFHEFKNKTLQLPWTFYGKNSKTGPQIRKATSTGTDFTLLWKDQEINFSTNLVGEHNILNITTVILFALSQGIKNQEIDRAIKNLGLVRRRQELRGQYKGALVIDDFAHHPRAVEVTIDAIKSKFPQKKIVAILGPSSATARSSIFQNEFTQSLKQADVSILAAPTSPTSVVGAKDLDCQKIARELQEQGHESFVAKDLKELRNAIDRFSNDQSVLLIMSNSTCNGLWESDFVKELVALK